MKKGYLILVSIILFAFSVASLGIGFALVNVSDMKFLLRVLCNYVFLMQFMASVWVIRALYKVYEERKK